MNGRRGGDETRSGAQRAVALRDMLFAEAAAELKLLSEEQVRWCRQERAEGDGRELYEVAMAAGLLALEDVKQILQHQAVLLRRMQAESALFGHVAVQLRLLTREQLALCVAAQQKSSEPRKLGELAVERGLLTADQVSLILQYQAELSTRIQAEASLFGQIALRLKMLTREQLTECLLIQRQEGSMRRLGEICVERGYLAREEVDRILQHQARLAQEQGPGEGAAARERTLPAEAREVAAPASAVLGRVALRPAESAASRAEPTAARVEPAAPRAEAPIIVEHVPGEPRLNRLLRKMLARKASDLHLSSEQVPIVRDSGQMLPLEGEPPLSHAELRELLLEVLPQRLHVELDDDWDVDFAHAIEGLARFRANYFYDRRGVGGVFRQIPFNILTPEQLGLPPKVLELCWLSKGLVLVTGPTGSGKSTTLATLIDFINRNRTDHIITIEDPIEFVHENKKCLINQREVGTHTRSFKKALRAALREDPDIVLVGELRDLETVSIALETAETGHLVFGTLHTNTAPSTVDRVIDQFPADHQAQIRVLLAESLRGVVAQMLCRKVGGGRVAAYEVLIANPAVANLIREGKTTQLWTVMQTGKSFGMQSMNEDFLRLVQAGQVEPVEAYLKAYDKPRLKDLFEKNNIELPPEVLTDKPRPSGA